MRYGRLEWTIVFAMVLVASGSATGSARADFMPSSASTFVGQFQAFLADFPQWDTVHQDMPLIFLATTPEDQRPQALVMLWILWMRDQMENASTSTSTGGGSVASLPPGNTSSPGQGGSSPPGGGGSPPGGGHTSGSAPEPSSLALLGCGSLGLLAYRLVRSRVFRGR